MAKSRMQTVLGLMVVAGGLLVSAILGLFAYVSLTATPIHPKPQEVASVARSSPVPAWADAVTQGREIVRARLSEQNLPGVSVAVGIGGDVVWAEGFGFVDLETRVPIAPETRFRIGTASTALTSAAVGLLLEKNRLTLDEKIQTYVPEFPEKPWPVTLRQVMGHTAGLRNDGGDEAPLLGSHCERTVEGLEIFAQRSLLFEPGTQFRYSNYGWILVSAAIESAANEPFLTFMRKQVFEPLGMDDTLPDSATERIPDRATPYFPRFAGDPRYGPDVMRDIDLSCYAGSAVFLSTPTDLVRFAMAMSRGQLLQPATVQLLQSGQRLRSGEETGYGLGWDLETATVAGKPARVVGHDGDVLGGMVGSFMIFPDQGIVVSVLANTSYADTYGLAVTIAEAFVEKWKAATTERR